MTRLDNSYDTIIYLDLKYNYVHLYTENKELFHQYL